MSDSDSKTSKTKTVVKRWTKRIVKIVIWLTVISAVILFILSILRGNSDLYKESMEGFLGAATGYDARIENFENLSFYPLAGTTFGGLTFYAVNDTGEATDRAVAQVESADVYIGFWDMFFSNGQMRAIDIKGFSADAGVFTDKAINVSSLTITGSEADESPALVLDGIYGAAPLDINAPLRRVGKDYGFDFDKVINLSLGSLQAAGRLSRKRNGQWENLSISKDGQEVITGSFKLGRKSGGPHISGDFTLLENGSQLRPDIVIRTEGGTNRITGSVKADTFHFSDLSGALALINDIETLLFTPPQAESALSFGDLNIDLDIDIKTLVTKKLSIGHIEGPLTVTDNVLRWPMSGTISEGKMEGDLALDATQSPYDFSVDMEVHDLDYGEFQHRVLDDVTAEGKGDLKVALTSAGVKVSDIVPNLQGKVIYIGGKGRLNTNVLNLWGGGLINNLLPDLSSEDDLALNCMIMDFGIEKGVATANALFADTARVTVGGEGEYDIANNRLDLKLKPQTKDVALGDVAAAVTITGPIENPSISPSMFDLGAKIGGLLLGTINPAFLAFTLTDLGLTDQHPCATYMQGEAEASEEAQTEEVQTEETTAETDAE